MKKTVVVLICFLLTSSFAACNRATPSEEATTEDAVSEAESEITLENESNSDSPVSSSENMVQIPNPIVEQDNPDFTEKLGFKVEDYPRKDQLTRCATIGDLVGEMDFALPQGTIELHVAKDGGGDVSGVYNDVIETISDMDVNGINVTVRSFKDNPNQMLYGWIKDGYIFSLHFKDIDDSTHSSMITEQFIEQIVMDPATVNS